jgi:acetylornithine deacetylase/succinyl-diaminopimelate desuccinylase-like protein
MKQAARMVCWCLSFVCLVATVVAQTPAEAAGRYVAAHRAGSIEQASYNAVRTPMDLPIAQEVISAVRRARGDLVALPTMGGSLPLESIEHAANTHTIIVPIANYDDNQHAADENLRLQNLWDGTATMAALMEMN